MNNIKVGLIGCRRIAIFFHLPILQRIKNMDLLAIFSEKI